jgi:hypothetical protein
VGYFIDAESTSLAALRERLQSTDLIPSQEPLLEGITEKISALDKAGIHSLADLRANLKASKSLTILSKSSGISEDYLVLLRRTIEGFFPKPRPFKGMDWLDKTVVRRLQQAGLNNTQQLFEAWADQSPEIPGLDKKDLAELVAISNLCRIQWVSPSYARALVAAGFGNASKIASADPEALCAALEKVSRASAYNTTQVWAACKQGFHGPISASDNWIAGIYR